MAEPLKVPPGADTTPDQPAGLIADAFVEFLHQEGARQRSHDFADWLMCALHAGGYALAEGGRLLPSGAVAGEQWGVEVVTKDGVRISVKASEREARSLVRFWRDAAPYVLRRLLRREVRSWPDGAVLTGPWEAVDG